MTDKVIEKGGKNMAGVIAMGGLTAYLTAIILIYLISY